MKKVQKTGMSTPNPPHPKPSLPLLAAAAAAAAAAALAVLYLRGRPSKPRLIPRLTSASLDAAELCALIATQDERARATRDVQVPPSPPPVTIAPTSAFCGPPFRVAHLPRDGGKPPAPGWPPSDALVASLHGGGAGVVADLDGTHRVLLNKWPLLRGHVLLVRSDRFLPQSLPMDAADARVAWAALRALGGLAFYNCGLPAGPSQPRRHVQVLPGSALRGEGALPLDAAVAGAVAAARGAGGRPFTLPSLPFPHYCALLDGRSGDVSGDGGVRAAYEALLEAAWPGSVAARAEAEGAAEVAAGLGAAYDPALPYAAPFPHNVLITPSYCLLVPRRAAGARGVDINALGYAGLLLSRGGAVEAALVDGEDVVALLREAAGEK